eukprot:m51a1_g5821 hypothetical protein (321) ;mRNA; f:232045-233060
MAEDWTVKALNDFLCSPHWASPIASFFDTHCHLFCRSDGEFGLETTAVHAAYRDLVETLLGELESRAGMSEAQLLEACQVGALCTASADLPALRSAYEALLAADDFAGFAQLMSARLPGGPQERRHRGHRSRHEREARGDRESAEDRQLKAAVRESLRDARRDDRHRRRKADELQRALDASAELARRQSAARELEEQMSNALSLAELETLDAARRARSAEAEQRAMSLAREAGDRARLDREEAARGAVEELSGRRRGGAAASVAGAVRAARARAEAARAAQRPEPRVSREHDAAAREASRAVEAGLEDVGHARRQALNSN